jgi:hypothetical protein
LPGRAAAVLSVMVPAAVAVVISEPPPPHAGMAINNPVVIKTVAMFRVNLPARVRGAEELVKLKSVIGASFRPFACRHVNECIHGAKNVVVIYCLW